MADNRAIGALLAVLIAIAAIVFVLHGGVSKKTVTTDEDLPPVASGQPR
jgi:hypothetical protein